MGDVDLLHRIEHFIATGEVLPVPSFEDRIKVLKKLVREEIELRGKDVGVKFSRKFYPFYVNGFANAAKVRARIVVENDVDKIFEELDSLVFTNSQNRV